MGTTVHLLDIDKKYFSVDESFSECHIMFNIVQLM